MKTEVLLLAAACAMLAQDVRYPPQGEEIPGPRRPADFSDWLKDIQHWRAERRIRIGYDGAQYSRPELKWAQSSFIQPQMMVEDRYFYDPVAGKYTVDRYLDDLEKRYGGVDSVLVWHTYPNIGIDNRNQYDMLRAMPGGIKGVKEMVADFHRRGVRVFFPMMLWDQGTREEGVPDWTAVSKLMAEVGADGVNGDTMDGVPLAFRDASDATGHPLVFEPESGLASDEILAWNNMTWGYWKYDRIPTVSRYKWLEPRHMVNICRRWARDKTDDLQHTFFNGAGYESWENIWGIWNQIDDRDAESLRRMAKVERLVAPLLVSSQWEPHTPVLQTGVYASKFPGGDTVWLFVNRNEYAVSGPQIRVPHTGGFYYDLWNGVELKPAIRDGFATIEFAMEPLGFGAVLQRAQPVDELLGKFLAEMKTLAARPLATFQKDRPFLPQQYVKIEATAPAAGAPPGMAAIPGGRFVFQVSGIEIEGGNEIGVDFQYHWEDSPRRHHVREMQMRPFFIDRYPVTNAEFKKFLDATGYRPPDGGLNFLRDWKGGMYPDGWARKPVTWVSIEDARAYAKWAGKRLPREWEWQYAAQGGDGRLYPWGNDWNPAAVPVPDTGRSMRGPDDAGAHAAGSSPFGVEDLVGNVWQWTDEYLDDHTRAAVLRGGSYYQPQGSHWYFPQAYKLNEHGKYLLMSPSKDRSGGVGFRCVVDAR